MELKSVIDFLERNDKSTRMSRAERLIWISKFENRPEIYTEKVLISAIFEEARSSFVNGNFISVVIVSTSYIEQFIVIAIENTGVMAKKEFAKNVELARSIGLFDGSILDNVDRLRKLRNPLVHKKDESHVLNLRNRMLDENRHPTSILEGDAQLALSIMYSLFEQVSTRLT